MTNVQPPERPGQRLHELVATLERMFAGREDVAVDAPLRLRDSDTGRLREHDVVITRRTHRGETRTALECRDHARKVGVPQIEGFAKKCERTGIHHGIVVSASGFTATARTKAEALNLGCMTLSEAEGFDWIGEATVIAQTYNFRSIEGRVRLVGSRGTAGPVTIYAPDGSVVTGDHIRTLLVDRFPSEIRNADADAAFPVEVTVALEGCYIRGQDGERLGVAEIAFSYILELAVSRHRMALHDYAADGSGLQVASAEISSADGRSTIALVSSAAGITGYLLSDRATEHRLHIGDLPERRIRPHRAVPRIRDL